MAGYEWNLSDSHSYHVVSRWGRWSLGFWPGLHIHFLHLLDFRDREGFGMLHHPHLGARKPETMELHTHTIVALG